MPQNVNCPQCNKQVSVPDGMGGKQMRCPQCRKTFPIPNEPAKAPVPAAAAAPRPGPGPATPKAAGAAPIRPASPSNQGIAAKPSPPLPPPLPRHAAPTNQGLNARPGPAPAPPTPRPGMPHAAPHAVIRPAGRPQYPHLDKREGEPAKLARVPGVRVAQLVMDYLSFGWTPEEMCRQHSNLTPSECHAAMAYYYDNRSEIEAEIQSELNQVEQDKVKAQPSPFLLKMRTG